MNKMRIYLVILFSGAFNSYAQTEDQSCRVKSENLVGKYSGACKNGLADGKGEAIGEEHRYSGSFKAGLPDGPGAYYYSDSVYHLGSFQNGLREGRGEAHHILANGRDSVIDGFWSGDKFIGKKYMTYKIQGASMFDNYEIIPSRHIGHSIIIEIKSTTGSIAISEVSSINSNTTTKLGEQKTGIRRIYNYNQNGFPAKLLVKLANGQSFQLDLYKPADWMIRLYANR
jgi:hypothetical protein